jgi:hypothetical protein
VPPDPRPVQLAPSSLCQGRVAPAAPVPPHSRAVSLTAAARGALPKGRSGPKDGPADRTKGCCY